MNTLNLLMTEIDMNYYGTYKDQSIVINSNAGKKPTVYYNLVRLHN